MCVQDVDVQCVLQFTLLHAAGCALHRHTSRVIHRLELCHTFSDALRPQRPALTVHRQYIGHGRKMARGATATICSLNRRKRAEKRPPPEALPVRTRQRNGPGTPTCRNRVDCGRRPVFQAGRTTALDVRATRWYLCHVRPPPRQGTRLGNDPSAGSPTETLLRLLLPLDSQVRPSSQRSARAVGRPRRGRSEGLTKPSNR